MGLAAESCGRIWLPCLNRTSLVPTDISQQREALHLGWGAARNKPCSHGHQPAARSVALEQALFPRTSASSAKHCTSGGVRRVTSLVPTDISQQREALHLGWGAARSRGSDHPYQADSDGSGHDMVWLDLSAR